MLAGRGHARVPRGADDDRSGGEVPVPRMGGPGILGTERISSQIVLKPVARSADTVIHVPR
jgi:hypothetical protein